MESVLTFDERMAVSSDSIKISAFDSLQVASMASISSRRYSIVRTESRGTISSPKTTEVIYWSVLAAASGESVPGITGMIGLPGMGDG